MKNLIRKLLREGLTKNKVEYKFEHLDSYGGQNNYELGMYLNGEVMGMIQYTTFEGEITISDIIVRPEFRRKGFGSRMVQAMKNNHPNEKYIPSMKTDLGAKFKHKKIKDINSIDENNLKKYIGDKIPVSDIFPNDNVHKSGYNSELMKIIDVYKDDESFEQNPVEDVDIKKIIPTQKFISRQNLEDVKGTLHDSNTGAYLVNYKGLYYVIDGHHRIATKILYDQQSIKAFVHTI